MSVEAQAKDPRLTACIDLARRCGAQSLQIRYSDDEQPVVWMAVASFRIGDDGFPRASGGTEGHEAAGALMPLDATFRLVEQLVDGSVCRHCQRPAGVTDDWERQMPLSDVVVCWYVFDPETEKFRRSCEGDVPKQGRNDPCFCGSGRKFKNCHGA
jgi:hypothetical protein